MCNLWVNFDPSTVTDELEEGFVKVQTSEEPELKIPEEGDGWEEKNLEMEVDAEAKKEKIDPTSKAPTTNESF